MAMSLTFYLITAPVVFVFSGLMAMAGLDAAFLFVPFFYYLGVPLAEAAPVALPLAVFAVVLAPFGARAYASGGQITAARPVCPLSGICRSHDAFLSSQSA